MRDPQLDEIEPSLPPIRPQHRSFRLTLNGAFGRLLAMRCLGIYSLVTMASYKQGEIPSLQECFPLMTIRASLAEEFPGDIHTSLEALRALCDLLVMR